MTANIRSSFRKPLPLSALALLVTCATSACGSPPSPVPGWSQVSKHESPLAHVPLPVEPAADPARPNVNPFLGRSFYVDPGYQAKVRAAMEQSPELEHQLRVVEKQPTALWLDRIAAIDQLPAWLSEARSSQLQGRPTVPVIVVYNLPNRDCAAKSSSGELLLEANGEQRYRTEYIDVIARHIDDNPEQQVAIVLEPDSLPNLVSNLAVEKCAVSKDVYRHSVAYAIARLSRPNVAIYLDVAHAGWLGWETNQRRMVELVAEVLSIAGGSDRIRGFASNVSNYNALHGDWGKRLEPSNPASNELTYVRSFLATAGAHGITDKAFLVDTSRNGQEQVRSRWGNWCNVAGAGLGERPTIAPMPGVDAYFWVKPPGESDGTADRGAARFDENCVSADATAGAPEAGQWFQEYFVQLVRNANPPL